MPGQDQVSGPEIIMAFAGLHLTLRVSAFMYDPRDPRRVHGAAFAPIGEAHPQDAILVPIGR